MFIISINFLFFSQSTAFAANASKVENYFDSIQNNSQALTHFLQKFPKGGDLHTHLGGAAKAENLLKYALNDHYCIDQTSFTVSNNEQCAAANNLNQMVLDKNFRHHLIDTWTMRHFKWRKANGHDHFFQAFAKFGIITHDHTGDILAEMMQHAAEQNIQYLEIMITPDNNASGYLGKKAGFNADFNVMQQQLLMLGLEKIIAAMPEQLNKYEKIANTNLQCQRDPQALGCHTSVRYLYQVMREHPPEMVFAQLLAGFMLAQTDERVVGINMVQPEDGTISMRDYHLHMQMLDYLHKQFPNVAITLHAGELTNTFVSNEGLSFHINEAVNIGHALRIGHGVDIDYEQNKNALLADMAAKNIMVEINLTSNAEILAIPVKNHPIKTYLNAQVPIAFSTDDEGITRHTLSQEYKLAATALHLSYQELKNISRNSLNYSFVHGENLWLDANYQRMNDACYGEVPGNTTPSAKCSAFISKNAKATIQWQLEQRFNEFEANYQ